MTKAGHRLDLVLSTIFILLEWFYLPMIPRLLVRRCGYNCVGKPVFSLGDTDDATCLGAERFEQRVLG
jgi:hypothetical protein